MPHVAVTFSAETDLLLKSCNPPMLRELAADGSLAKHLKPHQHDEGAFETSGAQRRSSVPSHTLLNRFP